MNPPSGPSPKPEKFPEKMEEWKMRTKNEGLNRREDCFCKVVVNAIA